MHRELMRLQNSHQTDRSNQYTAQDGENFIASESDRQFLLIKYVLVSFSLPHALAQNHTYLVNMCMCILSKNCVFYLLKIQCWIPVLFLCIRWKDIFRFLFIFSKLISTKLLIKKKKLISTKLQKSPFWLLKINVTSLIVLELIIISLEVCAISTFYFRPFNLPFF